MIDQQATLEAPSIDPPLDLDRALGFARPLPYEATIIQQVRERSRVAPAVGCRINLSGLARLSGFSRQSLSLAKRNLIDSRILQQDEVEFLRINVRAEEWIFPGSGRPRLTAKLLEFCRSPQATGPATATASVLASPVASSSTAPTPDLLFGSGLDRLERDILLALLCAEQGEGACTLSNKELAEQLGKSPRTVQRGLAGLRQKNLIECTYNPDLNDRVRIKFLFCRGGPRDAPARRRPADRPKQPPTIPANDDRKEAP